MHSSAIRAIEGTISTSSVCELPKRRLHVLAEEFAERVGRKFGKGHHGLDLRELTRAYGPARFQASPAM